MSNEFQKQKKKKNKKKNKKQKQKTKTKIFCFEIVFIHGICMCEGVGEDSRYGAWHVDIHIETCMFYMNV